MITFKVDDVKFDNESLKYYKSKPEKEAIDLTINYYSKYNQKTNRKIHGSGANFIEFISDPSPNLTTAAVIGWAVTE